MVKTTKLGGTAKDVVVAKVAHGLMTMTCTTVPVPDEQAFESIKSGIDALPPGAKMMLNSSQFYGHGWTVANLELLARFFDKYPEYADKTFLSVKGGATASREIECSRDNLRRSVDVCIDALRGTKKIDLFEPARIDRSVSIEDTMRTLAEMGGYVASCPHHLPRLFVEIEISPMVYEEETKRVIAACAELDVAIAAYSPLGHGLTTGTIKKPEDMPGPFGALIRVKGENWDYTRRLVDALIGLAAEKGCTPAQLSIAWVGALGEKVIPLPGSSRKQRTLENLHASDIELSAHDLEQIARVIDENPLHEDRGFGPEVDLRLWG